MYKLNAEHLSSQILTLQLAHTEHLIQVTRRLAAITILLMDREPASISRAISPFTAAYDYCEDEVAVTRTRVNSDIATTESTSRGEILDMSRRAIEIARELNLEEPVDSVRLVRENSGT